MPHHELHDEHLEPDVVDEHDVVITEDEVDDEAHEYDEMLHVVLPDEYEVHESSDIEDEDEVEVVNEIKLDADLTDEETEYDVIILDIMLLTTDEDEVEQDVQPNDDRDVNE